MKTKIFSIIFLITMLFINFFSYSQNWILAKHAGGIDTDASHSIALDQGKNIYIGGKYTFQSYFDFDTIPCNGLSDFFLAKYDTQGNLTWVKHGGGSANNYNESIDFISDIKITNQNEIFITGAFNGTAYFGTNIVSTQGSADFFVARYDTNGNCIWVKTIGGIGIEAGQQLVFDSDNNLYITGSSFYSSNILAGNLELNIGGHQFFLVKYDRDGNLKWIKTIKGSGSIASNNVHFYNNKLYCVGLYSGNIIYDSVSFNTAQDYLPVIFKIDTSGTCTWGMSFDCEEFGVIYSVGISDSGSIYCVGQNVGKMIVANDTIQDGGGFALKIDPSGNPLWLKKLGNIATVVNVTANNQIIIGGGFAGTQQFSDCQLSSVNTLSDLFIVKLNANGDCEGITSVSSGSNSHGISISDTYLDNYNQYYITGSCYTTEFGNTQLGTYGNTDAFWAKLDYFSGLEENKGSGENKLYIYANPNSGIFNIEVPTEVMNEKELVLKIYDNSNHLVKIQQLDMTDETLHVEVPDSKPGFYYLTLLSKKRIYSGKLIVQ